MSLADQQWCPTSVQVTVLQARGLRIKGKSGTNDAYAVMQLGKEKYQTSVVEKSVAPVWKEEATFDLPQLQGAGGGGGTLHVHVLHRALVGPDKLLGQAVINLPQLSEDKTRNKTDWFKLLDKTGKPDKDRGEVLVDIQFMRNNMTASMFDLSAAGKSRSRLGKIKDKVRGKKKESDSASSVVPSFTQVLTDSEEEEANGEAIKEGKSKKHKMKSLFSPKSNLQRNMSQSMSVLPAKNSSLSGSQSSGLNVDSSDGKKKFKFMIHKRSGSSDGKDSSSGHQKPVPVEQSNLCINGSHIYCEEPPPRTSRTGSNYSLASSGRGSMEEVPENSPPSVDSLRAARQYSPWMEEEEDEEEKAENIQENVDESKREEDERIVMERKRKEEEFVRRQKELESLAEEKLRQEERKILEEKVRREEEERIEEEKKKREEEERISREKEERAEQMRQEKLRLAEEKKLKEEEERRIGEEKARREEEQKRKEDERAEEEKRRKEAEEEMARKLEELRRQREEEERLKQERVKRQAEEMARKEQEEYDRLVEEKRKLEEEKKRIEAEVKFRKEEKEKTRMEEEMKRKEDEERRARREEELEEKMRFEEQERKRVEEEKMHGEEEERIRKERLKQEEETLRRQQEELVKLTKEKLRQEEEERRKAEEEKVKREEEKRIRREEEMRREEQDMLRRQEEEQERLAKKILRQKEEERKQLEEKLKREEEEQIRRKEEMRQKEEEEARMEKEAAERLTMETKRQQEQEKRRIEEVRKEEEERIRGEERAEKERKEKEAKKLERTILTEVEECEKKESRANDGGRAAGSSPTDITSTNPFDEDFSYNPSVKIPSSSGPHSHEVREEAVQERCQSSVSIMGSRAVSANEKDLIDAQREKRPAPQPPGKNQAERQREDQQNVSEIKQTKDKTVKTVSVLPQRSVQIITPLSKSTDSENTQSVTQNTDTKVTSARHSKRPAPSRPRSVEEPSSESKTTLSHKDVSETKEPAYGLNPFEDDEDENELTAPDDTAVSGPVHWPPIMSRNADKDASSQVKVKSSKMAPAPPPPAKNDTTSANLINHNNDGDQITGIDSTTVPNRAWDPQSEAKSFQESPNQELQQTKVKNIMVAGVKEQGPSTSRRLQPVKPLNPPEQQSASVVQVENNKSTGILSGDQDKTKVDSRLAGPYSQLTREELISLVLKQESQLSQRDKKISELEQYIDNLLVRVMEEKPSILMSMISLNKAI